MVLRRRACISAAVSLHAVDALSQQQNSPIGYPGESSAAQLARGNAKVAEFPGL